MYFKAGTTMTRTENDFFAITQKILDARKDFRARVSQYSTRKKSCNHYDSQMPDSETHSFVVDWQLPKMGNNDTDKS
jgi:hypothetical protein